MRSLCTAGFFLAFVLLGAGCTHYEYDLVRPPDLARHIGTGADVTFPMQPLEYRLRTFENLLVMRIYNPTPEPIRLLGDQSFAVDASRQSHPLRSQSIAPGSFIKLIFPPQRPRLEPTGPSIGIGFGAGFASGYPLRRGYGYYDSPFYDPYWDRPRYYTVYDNDELYWDWPADSEVTFSLVYQHASERPFTHSFVIRRKKM